MTKPEELNDLMIELLENNTNIDDATNFTDRGREIINEISDYAESTQIYQKNKEREETFDDLTAHQLFFYMLDRFVNAPTFLYGYASIILLMPRVRKKMQEEEHA